jgi:tRNA pseudouridine38-40 synthase
MQSRPFSFLFSITYFGARFKGWAVQPGQPTVQGKLEKVLRFVLGHDDFTVLGSSRTDAGVSCRSGFVQIFLREKVELEVLLPDLNLNLGGEIKLNSVRKVLRDFNLIQSVKRKTYRYFFSDSKEFHPFASSLITQVFKINALPQMQENTSMLIGKYDFRAFCKVSENKTDYEREILEAKVYQSKDFNGDFFPENVYCFEVTGTGFLHHQVRKMVSAIWYLTPQEISQRLEKPSENWENIPLASANGLVLWETVLEL